MPDVVRVEGDRELRHLLNELPKRVESKGNRQAVTAGAKPIARAMKQGAPRGQSRLLAKSIGTQVKSTQGSGRGKGAMARIGARKNVTGTVNGKARAPARYIHLVDKGTRAHGIPITKGPFKGHILRHPGARARPFVDQAFTASKAAATTASAERFKSVVESEAVKLGKR